MQAGERITLIKRVAAALAEDDWTDIALTLGQFGLAYDDRFDGGNYEFVIDAVESASDETLIELYGYLHPDGPALPSDPARTRAGGPWDEGAFRLFASHTSAHAALASDIRNRLQRVGIDVFVAHTVIEPTREWQDEIESALNTCDALVAMITADFLQSAWCDQEVGFCMARGVLIVPLRLGADPHGFIGKYQGLAVGAEEAATTISPRLFDLLATHDLTKPRMARPIVQRYVRSRSFQSTRDAFDLLKTIEKGQWTDQMAQDVLAAGETNGQIREAVLGDGSARPIPKVAREHLAELDVLPAEPAADDDIPF